MPNQEQMTINGRRKYSPVIKKRYGKAGKLERGRLLDEILDCRNPPTLSAQVRTT